MPEPTGLDERALAAALNAYGVDAVVDGLEAAIRAYLSALSASEAGWRDVASELPPLDRVVIVRYPSGDDGGDVFAWGARVDDGEGWLWGVKTGYDASVRPSEDASWNGVEVDDDYPVTHWMPLPSAPDRRAGE